MSSGLGGLGVSGTGGQGSPGPAGPAGPAGANGANGATGPAPAGTGIVTVTGGALGTPAPLTGDTTTTAGGLVTTTGRLNGATVPAAGALTVGQVLQVTGASSLGYAAITGGGWADATTLGTLGTFDFTAQATTTFNVDTTYVFGGFTWTKRNSAGDATAMKNTNGTGLVIVPAANTQWNGGTDTAPLLLLPFTTAIPSWYPGMPLRIFVTFAAQNTAANYDEAFVGVETNTAMPLSWRHGIGHDGASAWASVQTINGASTGQINSAFALTDPTMLVEYPDGIVNPRAFTSTSPTAYAAGPTWPALGTFIPKCINQGSNLAAQGYATSTAWPGALGGYFLALGAQRQGSGTALSVTVSAIRVQYRPS